MTTSNCVCQMRTKMFEVRDKGALIPVLATKMCSDEEGERWLLSRAGFRNAYLPLILVTKLIGPDAHYDSASWGNGRTMRKAHEYIEKHFDSLASGQVIDIEFLMNETSLPKIPERSSSGAA